MRKKITSISRHYSADGNVHAAPCLVIASDPDNQKNRINHLTMRIADYPAPLAPLRIAVVGFTIQPKRAADQSQTGYPDSYTNNHSTDEDEGVPQRARDGNVVGFLEAMSELRMDGLPSKENSKGFAMLDPEPDFTFTFTFVDTNTDVYAYVFAGAAAAVFALALAVVAVAADTANSEKIALTPQMRPCVTIAQILGGPEFGHAGRARLVEELITLVRDEWQRLHEGGALTL